MRRPVSPRIPPRRRHRPKQRRRIWRRLPRRRRRRRCPTRTTALPRDSTIRTTRPRPPPISPTTTMRNIPRRKPRRWDTNSCLCCSEGARICVMRFWNVVLERESSSSSAIALINVSTSCRESPSTGGGYTWLRRSASLRFRSIILLRDCCNSSAVMLSST
jgi:hypothetical protein